MELQENEENGMSPRVSVITANGKNAFPFPRSCFYFHYRPQARKEGEPKSFGYLWLERETARGSNPLISDDITTFTFLYLNRITTTGPKVALPL